MKNGIFIDREISWIDFNLRVLTEAEKGSNPFFERFNFISIFQSNFDEFFRVRVGSLHDKLLISHGKKAEKFEGQLHDIYQKTKKAIAQFDRAYFALCDECRDYFTIAGEDDLTADEKAMLRARFERDIAPFISPFIVEKNHPFPFFENGRRVVGVTLSNKENRRVKFGLIPVGAPLPECVILERGGKIKIVQTEQIIAMFAHLIFRRFTVSEKLVFTIIRNADIDENEGLYDYDVDFRNTMSKLIEVRRKLAPVELKFVALSDEYDKIYNHLKSKLCLKKSWMIRQAVPLSMNFFDDLKRVLPREKYPEMYYLPQPSVYPKAFGGGNIIKKIRRKDVLLSYPFDDVAALTDLLHEAALSREVKSIDISLYRVARDSKVIRELILAAENGKKVSCMVELRARFDEENNIDWSHRLEDAGCRVYYGLPNYKVHCKLIYIGMYSGKGDVVQIGTGNFNEKTAHLYTDLALFTADESIVKDVKAVFNSLKSGRFVKRSANLMVAPLCLKSKICTLIDEQIALARQGKRAELTFKLNSLTDRELMNKLIDASCAGVKIRLLIRGICCIVPGVPGKTENIEVRSIIGRYLEHSRIYVFGAGRDKKYYISSADFMTRNTDQRVEVASPVTDYSAKRKLARIIRLGFADNTNARVMTSTGKYHEIAPKTAARSMQSELFDGEKINDFREGDK